MSNIPSLHGSLSGIDKAHPFVDIDGTISNAQHGDQTGIPSAHIDHSIYAELAQDDTITGSWEFIPDIVFYNDIQINYGEVLQGRIIGTSLGLSIFIDSNDMIFELTEHEGGIYFRDEHESIMFGMLEDDCFFNDPLTMKFGHHLYFHGSGGNARGEIFGSSSTFIIASESVNTPIEFKMGTTNKLQILQTYIESSVDIRPTVGGDCNLTLGDASFEWLTLEVGTVNDAQCSVYDKPEQAFEVLAIMREFLSEDAPEGKIDSKNYPLPFRAKDEEGDPKPKGRNLSKMMDYVIYAMGDIQDKFNTKDITILTLQTQVTSLEERIIQLEA